VIVTIKKIDDKEYTYKAGGRLRNKCKQSKNIKELFHSEKTYGSSRTKYNNMS